MKLQKIELIGVYKGLRDQEFDFSTTDGNIAAFIGLNGTGKSQIFELIAEIFSYIERVRRTDFGRRRRLGFGFALAYQYELDNKTISCRITGSKNGKLTAEEFIEDSWSEIPLLEAKVPANVVGYSSGLNENLQRPFLKNHVCYCDVMTVRSRRRDLLSTLERRSDYPDLEEEINSKYLRKYPGIFGQGGQSFSEGDTPVPGLIWLDYDCNNLLLLSMALLSAEERNSGFHQIAFRHPVRADVKFDLRRVPYGDDAIEDILQLIRATGGTYVPDAVGREISVEYDDLEYKSGTIHIDLSSYSASELFRSEYRRSPFLLFSKLYKIYLLGAKFWQPSMKVSLRKDEFVGAVKKPVKARSPLLISQLILSDGSSEICADDLSDGEWQLIQVLMAVRVFSGRSIFLLDEPETHLNPVWRTQFHKEIKNTYDDIDRIDDFFCVSTHSPFLVSSLREESVFVVNKENGVTSMNSAEFSTFGAPFDVVIKNFFGMRSLISQTAIDEVVSHLESTEMDNAQKAAWIDSNMSDSSEKAYLLRRLRG